MSLSNTAAASARHPLAANAMLIALVAAWLMIRESVPVSVHIYSGQRLQALIPEAARRRTVQEAFARGLRERVLHGRSRIEAQSELAGYISTVLDEAGVRLKTLDLLPEGSPSSSFARVGVAFWFEADIEGVARTIAAIEAGSLELRIAALEIIPARIDDPTTAVEVLRVRLRVEALWQVGP